MIFFIIAAGMCHAHFGMVIPSDNMIMADENREISLLLSFSHPFEMKGMPLERPEKFMVAGPKGKTDLTGQLTSVDIMGYPSWQTRYTVKWPGSHIFVMSPKPFWEPAEDCFIVHTTKTVVAAFGDDSGWDRELGLKTEIIPLSRPFGIYQGNVFQAVVKLDGKVVPYAQIEVEYYNQQQDARALNDYMVTQTIKADGNGVFTFSVPVPGWWGFSALNTSDEKMMVGSTPKDVELGAVLWVKFESWQEK